MRNLPGGMTAAGKTGTAQVVGMAAGERTDSKDLERQHRDHAWFVTYAPAENPRIVVAVLVEHGGSRRQRRRARRARSGRGVPRARDGELCRELTDG